MPIAITIPAQTIATNVTQPPTVRGKRTPPRVEEEVGYDADTPITLSVFGRKSMQRSAPSKFDGLLVLFGRRFRQYQWFGPEIDLERLFGDPPLIRRDLGAIAI